MSLYVYNVETGDFMFEHPPLDENKRDVWPVNVTDIPPEHSDQRFVDGEWIDIPAEEIAARKARESERLQRRLIAQVKSDLLTQQARALLGLPADTELDKRLTECKAELAKGQ